MNFRINSTSKSGQGLRPVKGSLLPVTPPPGTFCSGGLGILTDTVKFKPTARTFQPKSRIFSPKSRNFWSMRKKKTPQTTKRSHRRCRARRLRWGSSRRRTRMSWWAKSWRKTRRTWRRYSKRRGRHRCLLEGDTWRQVLKLAMINVFFRCKNE